MTKLPTNARGTCDPRLTNKEKIALWSLGQKWLIKVLMMVMGLMMMKNDDEDYQNDD